MKPWTSATDVLDTNGDYLKVGWAYVSNDNQVYAYMRHNTNYALVWLIGGGIKAFDGNGAWETKTFTPIVDLYPLMRVVDKKLREYIGVAI